jgi:hypothetical protein
LLLSPWQHISLLSNVWNWVAKKMKSVNAEKSCKQHVNKWQAYVSDWMWRIWIKPQLGADNILINNNDILLASKQEEGYNQISRMISLRLQISSSATRGIYLSPFSFIMLSWWVWYTWWIICHSVFLTFFVNVYCNVANMDKTTAGSRQYIDKQ